IGASVATIPCAAVTVRSVCAYGHAAGSVADDGEPDEAVAELRAGFEHPIAMASKPSVTRAAE
ncbi:MAG TPA: hypothetical protein VK511_08180, partial [Gemmatimonadaceae bacterium]|nr:hypothetical protein [Gemmatimonadaceae bacterium]